MTRSVSNRETMKNVVTWEAEMNCQSRQYLELLQFVVADEW